jgi:hypothetical protein
LHGRTDREGGPRGCPLVSLDIELGRIETFQLGSFFLEIALINDNYRKKDKQQRGSEESFLKVVRTEWGCLEDVFGWSLRRCFLRKNWDRGKGRGEWMHSGRGRVEGESVAKGGRVMAK